MTDNEKLAVIIAGRKAFEYALANCSDALEFPDAVRAVKTALIAFEPDSMSNYHRRPE